MQTYRASDIKVLEGLEAVRRRPAMYIGSTGKEGLHHLVYEVVDNSIDEVLAGFCDHIHVIIHKDNSVSVIDNGRGIPIDEHPIEKVPAVQVIMTKLHAGGKFDKKVYKVSGGLHGVGVSVVNALSKWLEVEIWRDGYRWKQRYENGGKKVYPLKRLNPSKRTGTKVTFYPDPEIFKEGMNFSFETLSNRLRELAFLNPGTTIVITDERTDKEHTFLYKGGIKAFVEFLNENKKVLHKDVIYFKRTKNDVEVEVAMQYNDGYQETVFTYCNNIHTKEGGTHLVGFKSALTRVINEYIKRNASERLKSISVSGDDVREGLTCVIACKVPNPQFEGQTKTKLGNSEVKGIVESIVGEELQAFLEQNPRIGNAIIEKVINAYRAREAARKAKELVRRKSALEVTSLPGKLADCQDENPSRCELFIVEGESAGGSAKQARDRKFQAVLPLKGKIINVEKARLTKVLSNDEIRTMITAIGGGVGEDFDVNKIRYHKIIIMTDADVDGAHIRTLLLTFFFRHMRPLIEEGHLYIALPPLYKVKKGNEEKYLLSDEELKNFLISNCKGRITLSQKFKRKEKNYNKDETVFIVDKLMDLRSKLEHLEKKQVFWKDYLKFRERKKFPISRYKDVFIYDEEEEEEIRKKLSKEGEEVKELDQMQIVELPEIREVDSIVKEIEKKGFVIQFGIHKQGAIYYLKDESDIYEFDDVMDMLSKIEDIGKKGVTVQRYKGLGEMNPEQLWETTMDPSRRALLQVSLEDVVEADRIFTTLMGDSVDPRKNFIIAHALRVRNLDI